MTTSPGRLDWALYHAERGWPVFPLIPGSKRPAFPDHPADQCQQRGRHDPRCRDGHTGWEQRATTDPDRIRRAWAGADYNVGLATGPAGLVVVDLDAATDTHPAGADVLASLAAQRDVTVPVTYTVSTPSGGRHLYFATPPGVRLRNTSGTLGPHIDTRAHGGYVVAPDSVLPAGGYHLDDDTDPVVLPAWFVQALLERPPQPVRRPQLATGRRPAYVAAAVRGETDCVRSAPAGQHNAVLSRAAYALGQLAGADLLPVDVARAELLDAATALITADCHCTPREVARVIDAALAAGAQRPRTIPTTEHAA